MRRFTYAVAAALALSPFIVLASASSPAGAAATHPATHPVAAAYRADVSRGNSPLVSGFYYGSVAGYGKIWDDITSQFKTSHSNATALNQTDCNTAGYCELLVPNQDCAEWDYNKVIQTTCAGLARQLWLVYEAAPGEYAFVNDYGNSRISCSGGYDPVITSNSSGADIYLGCPDAGTGLLGNNQLFYRSPA